MTTQKNWIFRRPGFPTPRRGLPPRLKQRSIEHIAAASRQNNALLIARRIHDGEKRVELLEKWR